MYHLKVTLITVTYNSATTLKHTIESVINQSYPNIEYIIIDGNSTDGTQLIVESYGSAIHTFISEPDNGLYDAMNKGISLATGEVIGILNSDDVFTDNKVIETVADTFSKSHTDGVYGDLIFINKKKQVLRTWKSRNYRENAFKWGWMPPHPTFFVRKEIYLKYGVFNLALSSSADYELMLRFIHKHGIIIKHIPKILVAMLAGGQSNVSIKNRLRANREDKKAWKLNNLKPYSFTLYLKPFRKVAQFVVKNILYSK